MSRLKEEDTPLSNNKMPLPLEIDHCMITSNKLNNTYMVNIVFLTLGLTASLSFVYHLVCVNCHKKPKPVPVSQAETPFCISLGIN